MYFCVFYTTNEMQLCTIFFILANALHVSGGLSAHRQELIKPYMQPWLLSCFTTVYRCCGCVGFQPIHNGDRQQESMKYPRLHIQFYEFLMMGGKTARNM
jgi:hypothetical protein